MPSLTSGDLLAAGVDEPHVEVFLDPLNAACDEFEINTDLRAAIFLAQITWESGRFRTLQEIWGPTPYQLRYPGGRLYSGRGLIQITGLPNYTAVSDYFSVPLDQVAGWLLTTEGACRSAGWFWKTNGCNELADAHAFTAVTKKINGGTTALPQRIAIYAEIAKEKGLV